jgi:fermentation-respiration switch protein FrsA (DUF1100 family)
VQDPGANASGGSFAAIAAAGGFAISPRAGKTMTDAIDDALDRLNEVGRQLDWIRRGTPLGDSPAGRRMAQHNLSVAVGYASGEQAVDSLRAALTEHRAAIEQAVRSYRERDHGNAGSFR